MVDCIIKDRVALVTINNTATLNALSSRVLGKIASTINKIEADDSIKVIIFTGEGC